MDNNVNSLLGVSMEKIKEMVDVDTVVGTPIVTGEVTLIPVSKVTYGFAGGGSDLPSKSNHQLFGGGSGAGITVTPIAFISVSGTEVRLLPLISKPDTVDSLISKIPDAYDMVTGLIEKRKKDKQEKEEQA
ncbi:MAG: GerW family sporulation protein [Oscillospiraceae bacterium]|nr:GerW family sporulation protein [Oscillospiraceae bacterium]